MAVIGVNRGESHIHPRQLALTQGDSVMGRDIPSELLDDVKWCFETNLLHEDMAHSNIELDEEEERETNFEQC